MSPAAASTDVFAVVLFALTILTMVYVFNLRQPS